VPDSVAARRLGPAYGDHEIRKSKQHLIASCLFFRISWSPTARRAAPPLGSWSR